MCGCSIFMQHNGTKATSSHMPQPSGVHAALWDDPEMAGGAPPPSSWRGRPPLSLRFGNPARLFRAWAAFLAPVAFLRHLVPPVIAVATVALIFNWSAYQAHLARVGLTMSFVQSFILGLLVTNLLAKLVQGTAMARNGTACDEIGGRLAFGIIPKFYIFKGAIRTLDTRGQCACYAAPLLFRLTVFGTGILVWIMLLSSGSGLADYALSLGTAGLSSFIFTANPLFVADGYQWFAARLEQPKLRNHAFKLIGLVFTFRRVPPELPRWTFWLLLLFGLGSIIYTVVLLVWIVSGIAFMLEADLRGTGVVIFCILLVVAGLYTANRFRKPAPRGKVRRT
jgi:hypothetical protein